jgi:glycosyltransferase involved in cell wall biosynthesis
LQQTHGNIELIIVNDGSTDKTHEIIRSYNDVMIRYLKHDNNRGQPHALNTGFAKTTGDYLTWISDDNYFATDAIEKMLVFAKERNCPFVYCDFYRFKDGDPSKLNPVRLPGVLALEKHNDVGACFLYSKSVKDIVGDYDSDAAPAEDYDYWIRVSKKFSMCHLNELIYFYREHSQSVSLTRIHESKVVVLLLRIKHYALDVKQATRSFTNLMALKKMESSGFPRLTPSVRINRLIHTIVLYPCCRFLAGVRFSRRAYKVLLDFWEGRISFQEAKSGLLGISWS